MSRRLGATRKEVQDEESVGTSLVGRFKELGEYQHRCLMGPKRRESIIYPTIREDFETKELMPSYNSIILPPSSEGRRTLADKLAAIDRKVQQAHGVEKTKVRSAFSRSSKFIYIVFSRELMEDKQVWIGPWEYPYTVSKEITRLQFEVSKKSGNLRYGPYWTYDVIVNKYVDEEMMRKTSRRDRSIRYTVSVDPETNVLAGKLPVNLVEDDNYIQDHPEEIEEIYSKVFTSEELEIIDNYEKTLDSFVNPVRNDEDILQIFQDFPVNFGAVDKNDVPVFKHVDDLKEEFKAFGERIFLEQKALPANETLKLEEHKEETKKEHLSEETKEKISKTNKEKVVQEKDSKFEIIDDDDWE